MALARTVAMAADTNLADQPIFATVNPPGNMALAMSVEFPTAVSVAHTNRSYTSTTQFLGYFDPDKCYAYSFSSNDSTAAPNTSSPSSYFVPAAAASARTCNGQWSGNFLNWAMMQTIDTFRWVMTGGYRVIDTTTTTVLEKAWATGQGGTGNFPDSLIAGTVIAGATPFGSLGATSMKLSIQGLGNRMRFVLFKPASYQVDYFNSTDLSGAVIYSRTEVGTAAVVGKVSPAPGVNVNNWSSRYKTSITMPATGNYRFQTVSDDGARLYLNGTRVIDSWPAGGQGATGTNSEFIAFTAGDVVQVVIEYREFTGDASLKLNWQLPGSGSLVEFGSNDAGSTITPYDPAGAVATGTTYEAFTRAKVCDATVSLEANCKAYSGNFKPEGLMQQYSNKLRYSVFGYLNDSSVLRDGGVLRARQKFIGPTKPVYGSTAVTNAMNEWSPSTGIMVQNPDSADASATGVSDSGAMNYINKFGELKKGSYKGYDPVGELFYAVVRYFRNFVDKDNNNSNIGNVLEWYANADATAVDGFPVIKTWDDPILYSCQKNFILGIGDVNTHADKNLPGNTNTANEPTLPKSVANDPSQYLPYDQRFAAAGGTPLTPFTSTDRVGQMEVASGGTYYGAPAALSTVSPYNGCCTNNLPLIAGLAYDVHTTGIRPFDASKGEVAQTIDTYWVDVIEGQTYKTNNPYWLATKYGGFTVPTGYKAYGGTATALTDASWTNGDLIGGQKRPRNYFSGGDPATMQSGLVAAFADVESKLPPLFSTSIATASPQVTGYGTGSYSASYAASNWSGEIAGSSLTFNDAGTPTLTQRWLFNANLTAQTNRRIATWDGARGVPFAVSSGSGAPGLTTGQLNALNTGYVALNDSVNYLAYLRGDRSREVTTVADPNRVYRARAGLLGDIVNSKPAAVGPPAFAYAESTNPGYTAFKAKYANRRTVVYVGANDGMLHAVNGALVKNNDPETTPQLERDDNAGTEMFAYVPSALFQGPSIPATRSVNGLVALGNPSFVHHYMVDASPSAYDVDFGKTAGQAATAAADWRTILVGGLGKGGRSYYAIDITDPEAMVAGGESAVASKVLWEYSEPFTLGYTYGEPVVAKTKRWGWVVMLPSGYNNLDGNGHLVVLNARTGALLQTIDLGSGGAGNGLAHANSFIVDSSDGTVDSVYAGDLNGNVWRVDLTSATAAPAVVKLATLTDDNGVGQPITVRPTLKVDPTTSARRRFVMIGTGRLLDTSDIASTQRQSFYAIVDGSQSAFNATATNGVNFPIKRAGLTNVSASLAGNAAVDLTTKAGYWFDFVSDASKGSATSRMTSEASTFYNSVALVTSQPNVDICAPSGTSNLYGLDFGKAISFLTNTTGTAVSNYSYGTTATDVLFFSNAGKVALNVGFTSGAPIAVPPISPLLSAPRRVNWREVPSVE